MAERDLMSMVPSPSDTTAYRRRRKRGKDVLMVNLTRLAAVFIIAVIVVILGYIIAQGLPKFTVEFLTQPPRGGMLQGGVAPAIAGTVMVVGLMMVFALPVGMFAAIYLTHYAPPRLQYGVHIAVQNLAGVPSIVYGLFGLGFFVLLLGRAFGWDACMFTASLTLSILVLPTVIITTEEAIKACPVEYQEAAYALGAKKWTVMREVVLPYSLPGMLTGAILAIGRGAGETAPIIFTGAAFYMPGIPDSIFDQFMELSYHIWAMATQSYNPTQATPIVYGTVLVLLVIVLSMDAVAILLRRRFRARMRG